MRSLGGQAVAADPGRGPFLKNTKRSPPRGHFSCFGNVKLPRARGERARWVVAASRSTDRAGGGARLGCGGARNGAVVRAARSTGPGVPDGDVKPSGRPAEQRVLESAL